jgi:hypothetical protein
LLAEIWASSQPLAMKLDLPKIAKTYLKTIILRNFELPPKIEILMFYFKINKLIKKKNFPYIEEAPKHVYTIWIFITRIFHMPFLLSKNNLYMRISAYPFVQK